MGTMLIAGPEAFWQLSTTPAILKGIQEGKWSIRMQVL